MHLATVLATSSVRERRICRKAFMWKQHERRTLLMCFSIERFLSTTTPRLRTLSDSATLVPATMTLASGWSLLACWDVETSKASDLSAFSSISLVRNQYSMTSVQFWRAPTSARKLFVETEQYNCVSSAYWWNRIPSGTTVCSEDTYEQNKSGPNTEPCGTPAERNVSCDALPPILTNWLPVGEITFYPFMDGASDAEACLESIK